MQNDIEKILIDRNAISDRLDELAEAIVDDLSQLEGEPPTEITLVPILTGSIIFVADLIRRLPIKMQIRLMSVTSYTGTATSTQGAKVEAALTKIPESLEGLHVLVIDDILDSGNTLREVTDILQARNPASYRTCVLLRKQRPEAMAFPIDFVAFDIPDEFVVGFGLDYDDYYRNLPDIVTLKPEVISPPPPPPPA